MAVSDEQFRRLQQKFQKLLLEFEKLQKEHADIWPPRKKLTAADGGGSIELVAMTTDGGTGAETATFTYAFTLADGTSQSAISPSNARAATDLLAATYGLWCVDALGAGKLIALFEWPDYAVCDTGMDGGSA